MRVLLYGRFGIHPGEVEELIRVHGLEIITPPVPPDSPGVAPDVVVTYGGDGTLLGSERDYPGIPKLPLRNSQICHLCSALPNERMLELLAQNKLHTRYLMKLEAVTGKQKITALNDIILAHKFPNTAIRFRLASPDPLPRYHAAPTDLIGDGLVIATPFGSTGYFYSITHKTFSGGLALAFNNLHNSRQKMQLFPETKTVSISLTRGPAVLAADNDPNLLDLPESAEIQIKKSKQVAKILTP